MLEWPSNWQDLLHSSAEDLTHWREALLDSSHNDHHEAWETFHAFFGISEDVHPDAIHAVPLLYQLLPHGDHEAQQTVLYALLHVATDADCTRNNPADPVPLFRLGYDAEAFLQALQEGFDSLQDKVSAEWAPVFYTLGVLLGKMPVEDEAFLQQFPSAATEFFAANVLYRNMDAGTLGQWIDRFCNSEQKAYLQMAFLYPYLREEAPAESLMALWEHGEDTFQGQNGHFTRRLLETARALLEHTLLTCFDPLQLWQQAGVEPEQSIYGFKEDLLFAVYQRALLDAHPGLPGVVFNDTGVVQEAFWWLREVQGLEDFQLDSVELHLPAEVWSLLVKHHFESLDFLETLWIFQPRHELREKMAAVTDVGWEP